MKPLCPYCKKQISVKGEGLGFVVQHKVGWDHNVSVYGHSPEQAIEKWKKGFGSPSLWQRFCSYFTRRESPEEGEIQ